MIPGDHNSRTLLFRRVSSWSKSPSMEADDNNDDALNRPLLLDQLEFEERSVLSHTSNDDTYLTLLSTATHGMSRVNKNIKLSIVFFVLVAAGVSNAVLAKMESLPMYNYPTFLTIYANFMYIPISFIYILPVSAFGWFQKSIRPCHWKMSKRPFVIMGALDALSSALQILCITYLPGVLLVLLPQVAIPFSMIFSRCILQERFSAPQYLGAITVVAGIVVVLFPVLSEQRAPAFSCQALDSDNDCVVCETEQSEVDCMSHVASSYSFLSEDATSSTTDRACHWVSRSDSIRADDFLVFAWSLVLVASMIPMTLSSVYKQVALSEQINPIFVNGWVAIFQFLFSLPLTIPAGIASSPSVPPMKLLANWWNGIECLLRSQNAVETGCHPDDCEAASLWVHLALLSSTVTTIAVILMLKYGSTSMLYLALTMSVPLGHLVFELHSRSLDSMYNWIGLVFSVTGLMLYRFGHVDPSEASEENNNNNNNNRHLRSPADDEHGSRGRYWEFLREPFLMIGDV